MTDENYPKIVLVDGGEEEFSSIECFRGETSPEVCDQEVLSSRSLCSLDSNTSLVPCKIVAPILYDIIQVDVLSAKINKIDPLIVGKDLLEELAPPDLLKDVFKNLLISYNSLTLSSVVPEAASSDIPFTVFKIVAYHFQAKFGLMPDGLSVKAQTPIKFRVQNSTSQSSGPTWKPVSGKLDISLAFVSRAIWKHFFAAECKSSKGEDAIEQLVTYLIWMRKTLETLEAVYGITFDEKDCLLVELRENSVKVSRHFACTFEDMSRPATTDANVIEKWEHDCWTKWKEMCPLLTHFVYGVCLRKFRSSVSSNISPSIPLSDPPNISPIVSDPRFSPKETRSKTKTQQDAQNKKSKTSACK